MEKANPLNYKKNKAGGGFTLVELIVVISILAVLAAILVPALLSYIDKAKQKQYLTYAKNALVATQTELTDMYARGIGATYLNNGSNDNDYSKIVKDIIEDTGLSEAHITCRIKKNSTNYTIVTACYVYRVTSGGYYHVIFYDGVSWTELEDPYKELGNINFAFGNYAFPAANKKMKEVITSKYSQHIYLYNIQ